MLSLAHNDPKCIEGFLAQRKSECLQRWVHRQNLHLKCNSSSLRKRVTARHKDDELHFKCKFCKITSGKKEVSNLSSCHLQNCPRWVPTSCNDAGPVHIDGNLQRLSLEGCIKKTASDKCIVVIPAYIKTYEGRKQETVNISSMPLNPSFKEWRTLATRSNYFERNGRPYIKFNATIISNPIERKGVGADWALQFFHQGEGFSIDINGDTRIIKARDIFHSSVEIYHDITHYDHIDIDYFKALGAGIFHIHLYFALQKSSSFSHVSY